MIPEEPSQDPQYQQALDDARLALSQGDRPAAARALRTAIAAAELLPEPHLPLADALVRLGELAQEDGDDAEAEQLFRRALDLREDVLGPVHPDLVVLLNDLSRLYLKRSEHALAEPLLLRLHVLKRTKGDDHPEVATVLASLATVRQALGRHDAAEELWRRVLEIRERTLAPNHFAIATALEHLAETCAARGKLDEALRLMQRALAMRELTLDGGHPSLRAARERIADLRMQASDSSMAYGSPAPAWRPSQPAPAIPAASFSPVAPARSSAATATRAEPMTYAPPARPTPMPVPATANLPAPAEVAEPRARPMPVVMHSGDGALSLQQVLMQLEGEEDGDGVPQSRAAAIAAMVRARPVPSLVIAGTVVLVALLSAASAGAGDSEPAGEDAAYATAAFGGTTLAAPDTLAVRMQTAALGAPTTATTDADVGRASGSSAASTRRTADRPSAADIRAAARAEVAAVTPERTPEKAAAPTLAVPSALTFRLDSIASAATARVQPVRPAFASSQLGILSSKPLLGSSEAESTDAARTSQPARLIGRAPVARYPQGLRDWGIEGSVEVEFDVDTTGRPDMKSFKVVRSNHDLFSGAVRSIVPEMRFVPARVSGRKTRWTVRMPFQFSMKKLD